MTKNVSTWELFLIFAKMGAFTIGGGYVMLPLIEKEIQKRGWLDEDSLQEAIVLAQSAPGLLAVNLAIFIGHKLTGSLKGSIMATLGAIIPSFIIILLIAIFFTNFKDNELIASMFRALRPTTVALILVTAARMVKRGCTKWWTWPILLASIFVVAFMKLSPIVVIVAVIACGICISLIRKEKC